MTATHAARRLSVDAVLKMAMAVAQRHVDPPAGDRQPSADLSEAIGATWALVKARLGSAESAPLDTLIARVVGKKAQ